MKLDVVIPVGPGHEQARNRAIASVRIASMMPHAFLDVRLKVVDDMRGELGRSAARNAAVRDSDADWLFFLDADDLMHPDAITAVSEHLHLDAVFGTIMEWQSGCMVERYQVPEIRSYADLIEHDPYLTIQMGHFVQRPVAAALPFREDMDTGEDWDYYLRLWKDHDCAKIRAPLMINVRGQHSTGPRSATGQEWGVAVRKMLDDARQPS